MSATLVVLSELPEDHGSGSVRSTTSLGSAPRAKLDNIEWNGSTPNDGADLDLMKLEQINAITRKNLDELDMWAKSEKAFDAVEDAEKDYLGMFAYKNGEENIIMQLLITKLKPRTAIDLPRDDLETMALWLSNTIRLLNLMKQYGRKATFQEKKYRKAK